MPTSFIGPPCARVETRRAIIHFEASFFYLFFAASTQTEAEFPRWDQEEEEEDILETEEEEEEASLTR